MFSIWPAMRRISKPKGKSIHHDKRNAIFLCFHLEQSNKNHTYLITKIPALLPSKLVLRKIWYDNSLK